MKRRASALLVAFACLTMAACSDRGGSASPTAETDTIDKVHEPSLVPLTRATVRIVEGLRGQTAAGLRAQTYVPPRAAAIPPYAPQG